MFIIIPFVVIFLLYAYITTNDVSSFTKWMIYLMMFLTVIISFLIAKKIKSDLKQQKINVIKLEIYELKQRLKNRPNEHNDLVLHKIGLLEKELETYS